MGSTKKHFINKLFNKPPNDKWQHNHGHLTIFRQETAAFRTASCCFVILFKINLSADNSQTERSKMLPISNSWRL